MMKHSDGSVRRSVSSLDADAPILGYPVLRPGRSVEFSPDTVLEEANMTNAEDEAASSAVQDLSDSQYELVTESVVLSDTESRNGADSVASLDDYALDDASSMTGTDVSTVPEDYNGEQQPDQLLETAVASLDSSGFDSAATSQTVIQASSSTVELRIPYPSTRTNSSDAVPVHVKDKMPGWTLKYGVSPQLLTPSNPLRVAYCGDEELRQLILEKLARAVAESFGGNVSEILTFWTGPDRIDVLAKFRDQLDTGIPAANDSPTPASHLRKVLEVRNFTFEEPSSLKKFNADIICISRAESSTQDFSSRNEQRSTFVDEYCDIPMMELAAVPCKPLTLHYQHPTTGGFRMQTNEAAAVALKLFRLPVDVGTFQNIENADLNKHIAYLVEPKRVAKREDLQKAHGWLGFIQGLTTGFKENFGGQKARSTSSMSNAERLGLSTYYMTLVVVVLLGWAYIGTFVASKLNTFMPSDSVSTYDPVPNATAIPAYTATKTSGNAAFYTSSYSQAVSTRSTDTSVAVFAPFKPSNSDSWPAGLQVKVFQANAGKTYLFMGKALQKSKLSRDVLVKVTSGGVQLNASLTPVNETLYELDFGLPKQTYGVVDVSVWKEGAPQVTWKLNSHHKSQLRKDVSQHFRDLGTSLFTAPISQTKSVGEAILKQIGGQLSSQFDVIARETAISLRSTQTSLQKYYANAIEYYGKQSNTLRSTVESQLQYLPKQMDQATLRLKEESEKIQNAVGAYLADQRQLLHRRFQALKKQQKGLGLPNIRFFSDGGDPLRTAQHRAKRFFSRDRKQETKGYPHKDTSTNDQYDEPKDRTSRHYAKSKNAKGKGSKCNRRWHNHK